MQETKPPCNRRAPSPFRGEISIQWFRLLILLISFLWLGALTPIATAAQEYHGGGPFPTRNYNPVQLLFLSLPPETATTLPPGTYHIMLEMTESNTITDKSTPRVRVVLKFETFRPALHIKRGLTPHIEVGLEIPFLYRSSGFLDPFITSIEKAFSELSAKRIRFSDETFGGYQITRDGEVIVSGGNRQFGIGDLVLSSKIKLLDEGKRRPALAMRLAVKFPTGDFDRAFGSGKPDVGFGMAAQKALGRRWILYLNQSLVVPIGKFGDSDLTLNPIYTTAFTTEFLWKPRFSPVVQLGYYSSPFHGAGTPILDKGVAEIVIGFNYQIRPHILWQLYVIENFNTPGDFTLGAAADFTLATNVAFRF